MRPAFSLAEDTHDRVPPAVGFDAIVVARSTNDGGPMRRFSYLETGGQVAAPR